MKRYGIINTYQKEDTIGSVIKVKREPSYFTVYRDLKIKITSGEYAIGYIIPPEPQLEKIYSVSRTTVRKAISMLVSDGYISVKQGHGTEVIRDKKSKQNLNVFSSVSQTLKKKGYVIGSKSTFVEKIKIPKNIAAEMDEKPDRDIVVVHRIQTADGNPVSITTNYILEELVPGMENKGEEIVALYEYLEKTYGIEYTNTKDVISAATATYEEAALLGVKPGTALLVIKRLCYINNIIAEVDLVRILADKYEFEVNMRLD